VALPRRRSISPDWLTPSYLREPEQYRERDRQTEKARSAILVKLSAVGAILGTREITVKTDAQSSWSNSEQEAQTRNIQMIYDDPIALESLLEFLYTGTYTDLNDIMGNDLGGCRRDVEWNELLKKHAEVFTLADKYGVVTLKKLAAAAINIAATELSAFA
jgi:hypothetical protein